MTFKDAVQKYNENPTSENLKGLCRILRGSLTTAEKLRMLSGRQFLMRNGYDLITKGQKYNCHPCLAGGVRRLGIPAVAFSDGPRGVVMGNSTCFPVSMSRAASFDDELEYEIGSAIADEVIAGGGNYFAGICINLLRNPRWGRAQECYGEDQFLTGKMGVALTKAVQEKGVIACPKHYAVNSIENLRFSVNVETDEVTLHEVYLPHFRKCVEAGAMSIMGAYNLFRGDHCCESRYLLTDVLREQWGFEGFTISDFIFGVRNAAKALKSGLDIEMPMTLRYAALPLLLKNGTVKTADIDRAVEHILAGLIKITPKIEPKDKTVICSKEHTELAKRAAQEGTVLLKNNGLLPLKNIGKVAVVGRYANKINVGVHGSSSVFSPYTVTPYEGLCNKYGKENVILCEGTKIDATLPEILACDAVVICVGSDYKQEGENLVNLSKNDKAQENTAGGDRYSLRIPSAEVNLIHRICEKCENTVVNIIGGSAYIIEEWKNEPAAILESFYSGMEGGNALADILSGEVNPSGHLPFTMAKDENDYPGFLFPGDKKDSITYEYYHGYALLDRENKQAAFPFGFGLSYTDFEFGKPRVLKKDGLCVSLKVKNTGEYDGKTVVQVYAGAGTGDHPVKQLKAFKKVFIEAGGEKTVRVDIDPEDLKFYDPAEKSWYSEKEYTLYVGKDAEDAMNCSIKLKL
ncbi:MAG: glycoside hydrolase family 3 C-terminal domain-containing protein [Clostridia bacterium]|nr:glycoside hydrolase family 3 C-terminal domain-containing protein [Clostridia bacterium]